ncbi:hypothetical protein Tco_0655980, partial [Tanacetum coccineum]
MESSNSNSKERELQLMQHLVKQRHSYCMAWFEQLETHLPDLYLNSSSHSVDAFKPAFHSFFDFKEYTFCEPDTYRRDLVQAVDDSLIVSKSSWIESENNNALGKSVNETQLQQHESLVTKSTTLEANLNMDVKALDVGSVITESSGTKSDKHDTSSSSGTYITHAVDADIRPVNDQVPFAEVQLTAQHNVLANEQQHS